MYFWTFFLTENQKVEHVVKTEEEHDKLSAFMVNPYDVITLIGPGYQQFLDTAFVKGAHFREITEQEVLAREAAALAANNPQQRSENQVPNVPPT